MKKLILLLALACAWTAASADAIHTDGALTIVLTEAPCPNTQLAQYIAQFGITPPMAASIKFGEQTIAGCWAFDADSDVLIADEHGHAGYMAPYEFKRIE